MFGSTRLHTSRDVTLQQQTEKDEEALGHTPPTKQGTERKSFAPHWRAEAVPWPVPDLFYLGCYCFVFSDASTSSEKTKQATTELAQLIEGTLLHVGFENVVFIIWLLALSDTDNVVVVVAGDRCDMNSVQPSWLDDAFISQYESLKNLPLHSRMFTFRVLKQKCVKNIFFFVQIIHHSCSVKLHWTQTVHLMLTKQMCIEKYLQSVNSLWTI